MGISRNKAGADYVIKTVQGNKKKYTVYLSGVTDASGFLGPDFSVRYFRLGPGEAIFIYYGPHPKEDAPEGSRHFMAPFGDKTVTWHFTPKKSWSRAVTATPAGDKYFWSAEILAPDDERVRELAQMLKSFHER